MNLSVAEQIKTERLYLRRFQPEDAEEIFYTYASKPEATQFMAWPTHLAIDDTRNFLSYALQGWKGGTDFSFAIRRKGTNRMIGSCGMMNEDGRIQFGYVLGPIHWGFGYASEATRAMLEQVKNHPGIFRIGTFVDTENTASIRVLEKCGLIQEARLEKWFRFPNQNNQPKDCFLFRLLL
ncbi:MAG TPA: GNAT family N-acetyltransferase [Cyclobacteriaceae bacterium]|nr:GNAT family N-acetyltransferase [Cyclobacteriaceae bacterium]